MLAFFILNYLIRNLVSNQYRLLGVISAKNRFRRYTEVKFIKYFYS